MNNGVNIAKKSNLLNIIIGVLVVALIVVFFVGKGKTKDVDDSMKSDDDSSMVDDKDSAATGTSVGVTEPVGTWTSGSIRNELTFDVPPNYYVSYPVIGDCKDVVSITTQTSSAPTVPVALIYKAGCVTDANVLSRYTKQETKNGYVFQTNSTDPVVVSLFERIVASAK